MTGLILHRFVSSLRCVNAARFGANVMCCHIANIMISITIIMCCSIYFMRHKVTAEPQREIKGKCDTKKCVYLMSHYFKALINVSMNKIREMLSVSIFRLR